MVISDHLRRARSVAALAQPFRTRWEGIVPERQSARLE